MANRSLNQVMLIGNLTRDPELRYTPSGTAVITFAVATNRRWKTQTGEFKDEAQFHRIVAWTKLAELLAQLLMKGTRVFVEGRLQYRKWAGQDGVERQTTEIVASDVIVLGRGKAPSGEGTDIRPADVEAAAAPITTNDEAGAVKNKPAAVGKAAAPEAKTGAGAVKAKAEIEVKPEAAADDDKTAADDKEPAVKKRDKDEMPF